MKSMGMKDPGRGCKRGKTRGEKSMLLGSGSAKRRRKDGIYPLSGQIAHRGE